jgi:23S rRNA (uracil1939-C5)-methyltransferase
MKSFKNPICQHLNQCSGCQLDLKASNPPIWKEVESYFRHQCAIEPPLIKGKSTGWRYRAKLAVRGAYKTPLIGLFKEGTHEVISIPFCKVHHPLINRAIEFIRLFIQAHQLQPYNELAGQGELRYLQFVVERQTGRVQVSFVLNFKELDNPRCQHWQTLIKDLKNKDSNQFWHSLWINLNNQRTNTIFGSNWHCCAGEEFLWEKFDTTSVCFQPASFAQANLDLFEQMLERIKSFVLNQSQVAEFYAGVGVIGLFLASKCAWVKCAEINPYAEQCFSHSKAKLPLQDFNKITFHTGSAYQLIDIMKGASTVVVDPPRKGLDSEVLNALKCFSSIKQLIYVSCGWQSFKKDCDQLLEAGWKVETGEGYLFFPGSNHIEVLANFKRA